MRAARQWTLARRRIYTHDRTGGRRAAELAILMVALLGMVRPCTAAAQMPVPLVDRFTVEDGLARNWVDAVAQDAAGFIWTGTRRGLQRFDGYSFVDYAAIDSSGPPELRGPIRALLADRDGRLWVATDWALFRRGGNGQQPIRVPLLSRFRAWALGTASDLWIIDSVAVRRIDVASATPRVSLVMEHPSLHGCTQLTAAQDGALWLGCVTDGQSHLLRLDARTGVIGRYDATGQGSPASILQDAAGRVWVGRVDGLEVIDTAAGRTRSIAAFSGQGIRALRHTADGNILLAGHSRTGASISLVNRGGTVIDQWELPRDAPYPLDVIVDREGAFWVPTSTAGLLRVDPARLFEHLSSTSRNPLPMSSDFITALHACGDGRLWIGTIRGGAYRVSADWRVEATYRSAANGSGELPSNEVWDITEDRVGNHWIATVEGTCMVTGDRCRSSGVDGGTQLAMDAGGWFWLARTSGGVSSFHPRTSSLVDHLRTGYVMALYVEPDSEQVWIASDRLLRVRAREGRVIGRIDTVPATVSSEEAIYEIHRDRSGTLWLASAAGLQRWDRATAGFAPVHTRELRGLPVFSIEEDSDGRFWLGTGHGLVSYAPVSGVARRYGREHGVLNAEFNRRAAVRLRNGQFLFGGTQGLTLFNPRLAAATRDAPPIAFTRWRRVTADGVADELLDGQHELRLRTQDRAITIEFSALTFSGPATSYRYRLDGLDSEWLETTERAITYGSLPAGRYVLRVQSAAGGESAWSEPGAALQMQVVPPFWRTMWFNALIGLGLIGGSWLLHRLRVRQALATERLRVRIARDLHDDIGAGLSSIALLSDGIGSSGLGDVERVQLGRIGESARRMVGDLREIVWALDPEADHWRNVVARMRDEADALLPRTAVTFHAPLSDELLGTIGMTARRDLFLIYKEMLHNVARHAGATRAEIRLVARGDRIELSISDDGRGFDSETVRSGTGLRSMQARAARLGGKLEFANVEGGGMTTRLTFRRT